MKRVAIVGGCRTAFVKAGSVFARHSFIDLGAHVVRACVKRLQVDVQKLDEVCFGTVLLDPRAPNFAREMVFRSGLPARVGAHSVSNNCISGLVALNFIADGISTGRISAGLAGGSESMSNPALSFHPAAERFFLKLSRARDMKERGLALLDWRPNFMLPVPPSPKEPSTGLTMGEHCEQMAKEFKISREVQDHIAYRSHLNASKAQSEGFLSSEIEPVEGVSEDNIIRKDTSMERLAKLKPVFDRSAAGTLTAGNSSPLTDGASVVCLMSEDEARRQNMEVLAYLEMMEFSAVHPSEGLLMAPALAVPRLMKRAGVSVDQIDRFEIHEAFGAQVAANMDAWEKGWSRYPEVEPIGKIPEEKINRYGGSIAVGHPFAATGGRIALSLALQMKREGLKRGLISICAAGGMAGAALLTRP